jgi:hypothetical protein
MWAEWLISANGSVRLNPYQRHLTRSDLNKVDCNITGVQHGQSVSGCTNYVASPGLSTLYHVIQGGAEVPWHSRQRVQYRVSRDLYATLYIIQCTTQNSTVLLFVPTPHITTHYTTKYSKDCEMSTGVGMPVRSTSNLSDKCSTAVGRHCNMAWLFLPAQCTDTNRTASNNCAS